MHRDLDAIPNTPASLQQIINWDTSCRMSHSQCRTRATSLPTRVIDVGSSDGVCRLYESRGDQEYYMTLSHCWGSLKIFTTINNNLADLKRHIDIDALPKTFRDAIYITRLLKIRYLWIDSLCIIQDDSEDWARESAKMASIYHQSYLTLAATSAKDGSEGLFKPRDFEVCRIRVENSNNRSEVATVTATKGKEHNCLLGVHEEVHLSSESPPLMTRAWVYQERLLSARLLHFAPDEMVWDCPEGQDCECGLIADHSPFAKQQEADGNQNEHTLPDRTVFQSIKPMVNHNAEEETRHWYQLIQNYTMLSITKDEDRLPAFSGIASTLITAENYLAGIRRDHVERDLLWFTKTTKTPRKPKVYLAPSWSWASCMGAFAQITKHSTWALPHNKFLACIHGIETVKATSDAHGRVKGGRLDISGHFFKAMVKQKDRKDIIGSEFGRHWLRMEIPALLPDHWPYDVTLDTVEDAQNVAGSTVILLALWATDAVIYCLVLRRQNWFPPTYQRIGLVNIERLCKVAGKMVKVTVEDILVRSRQKSFSIV